jgi:hypothetical protein
MIPAPIEQGASADRRWGAVDIAACRRYVLDRQTAEGAFCFYGHSRWGKTEPVWGVGFPALVRQYVESCQSAAGGFGRMPHAIPRLTDTRLAVEVLSLLSRAVE